MARRWHLWKVRTRTVREDLQALPELSVTREKQHVVVRTAQRFLAERHVGECPCRFDVMAIDNCPGQPPVVRLHKDAFSLKCERPAGASHRERQDAYNL